MNLAFLIYKRPDLTARVFAEIARARPRRLLVVADGPRDATEQAACAQARAVAAKVDWPCEVLTNYSDANLGCRRRVASGLDWVFEQVDEAIVLEDDCLPHPSFFRYCADLLERFRDDPRVGHVGATNYRRGPQPCGTSYYFSRYCTVWGWATWRRAWRQYDVDMRAWPALKQQGWHYRVFPSRAEAEFFEAYWDDIQSGRIDTWDGQWLFALRVHEACSVSPTVNLVTNIGFGADASHAVDADRPYANVPLRPMRFPLVHPADLLIDEDADQSFVGMVFPIHRPRWQRAWWRLINPHWYGAWLRRLPGLGALWAKWRSRNA